MTDQKNNQQNADELTESSPGQLDCVVIPQTELQYALLTKDITPDIIILAKREKELNEAIVRLYWNKKAMSAKGDKFEMEDLMKDYTIAKIWIKPFAS